MNRFLTKIKIYSIQILLYVTGHTLPGAHSNGIQSIEKSPAGEGLDARPITELAGCRAASARHRVNSNYYITKDLECTAQILSVPVNCGIVLLFTPGPCTTLHGHRQYSSGAGIRPLAVRQLSIGRIRCCEHPARV